MTKKMLLSSLSFVLLLGAVLLFTPKTARAELVPLNQIPSNWGVGCGAYSAGQNIVMSKPPVRTGGYLDFRDQSINATPGQSIPLEIVIYTTSCRPNDAYYPVRTGNYISGLTVDGGASVSGYGGGITVSNYNRNVLSIDVVRIPISVTIPSDLSPGYRVYTVRAQGGQKINQFRSGAYQCVLSGGNRNGLDNLLYYFGCAGQEAGLSFGVNVIAQPKSDSGSCSVRILGSQTVAPGQDINVEYTVRNTGDYDWSVFSGNAQRYRLRNQNAPPWSGAPTEVNINDRGPNINPAFGGVLSPNNTTTWTSRISLPGNLTPGQRTFNWRIYGYNTDDNFLWIGNSCALSINVEDPSTRPYFRAYDGDVITGRSFSQNRTCNPSATGSKIEASVQRNSSGQWVGSGSELAVRATGIIDGFISRNQGSGTPNALTFGNVTPPVSGGARIPDFSGAQKPGSDSGAYTGCIPDYWNDGLNKPGIRNLRQTANIGSDGRWNGTIPGGQGYFWYAGNLTITEDIILPGWSRVEDIPRFYLVVRGNINIAPNVERIDGVIIAQPLADGTAGIVNTCAAASADWRLCRDNTLTFNGAVVANEIKLNRLKGNVGSASVNENPSGGNIAEVFNFLPELYLAERPGQLNIPVSGPPKYDSIIGLPPVL